MLRLAALLAVGLLTGGLAACVSPADLPGASGPAAAEALSVRTDSLLVSVDSLKYTVAVGYPQIAGASEAVSAEAVARVNAAIRDSVAAFARSLRPEQAIAPEERGSYRSTVEVLGGPVLLRLHGDVLSALVEVYFYAGGAHGNTVYLPVTYDLRTGAALRPADLFRAGTPWADSLSAHADRTLVGYARDTGDPLSVEEARATLYPEGYSAEAMQSVRFALGADSLTVQFAPYEVAYYAFGAPDVPVAYADLDAFLRPDGPAARIRAARSARQ